MQPLAEALGTFPLPRGGADPAATPEAACPHCNGAGWVRREAEVGEPGFGTAQACPACHGAERALLARVWTVSGLDPEDPAAPDLASFTVHDPAARRMLSAAYRFVREPTGWLTFHGQGNGVTDGTGRRRRDDRGDGRWGAGKSHLGEAIARALLARGVPALFITAPRLMQYAGAVWRPAEEEIDYDRRLLWLAGLPVLVVDEINKESRSEATERLRLALFDARYVAATRGHGGATVLLSNDRPARWADPALASRAMDARFVQVEVTSVDFRRVAR